MTTNCKNSNIIDKQRLDSIYCGVCYVLNSIEKCENIKTNNIIFFTRSVNELKSIKNIIKSIYYKHKFTPPIIADYIDCKSKSFSKKISAVILDLIYRTAILCSGENPKEFTDFNLIITVLANMLKSFI
ncbi:MAG: hypothetical protein FWG51_02120 [Firmicutes bacterium]|nr:hypothetical protein [Bacillota bacterium]